MPLTEKDREMIGKIDAHASEYLKEQEDKDIDSMIAIMRKYAKNP